ncbi:hypothetical protein ACJ72_03228 [Emergomyces africanus]|uniref:Uncharacterized protein n=1 Tax=Emergomyces africanus TaxID=1955775 RepID=A0A1B7P0M3_9EURO|nr:hypothetical protein ACJ72_03228 [Emergomyces africanus]
MVKCMHLDRHTGMRSTLTQVGRKFDSAAKTIGEGRGVLYEAWQKEMWDGMTKLPVERARVTC